MSSCESSEIQRQFAGIVQGLGQSRRSSSMPPSPMAGPVPAPPVYPNPNSSLSPMALSAVQPRSSSTPPIQPSSFRTPLQPAASPSGYAPIASSRPAVVLQPAAAPSMTGLASVPLSSGAPGWKGAQVSGASVSVYGKKLDAQVGLKMFPALFTAFCLATFMTPIVLCFHIGRDAQVLFWIGDYISWVVYLPVLYLGAYAYHTVYRLPSKMVMVVCLIGSCVALLILSDRVLLAAYDRANEFAARDCDTFPTKRELQREWESARVFYANCVSSVADELGMTYEAAYSSYRIRDCQDYTAQLETHPHWEYLGQLEEKQLCSGWCERAQPLWVGGDVKDSCSAVVGDIMMNKIQWTMMQVLVYTITVLGIVSVLLVSVGPTLWRYTAAQRALMREQRNEW